MPKKRTPPEGDGPKAYQKLHARFSKAVKPTDFFEQILVRDIVDATWNIFRLRRIRGSILPVMDGRSSN